MVLILSIEYKLSFTHQRLILRRIDILVANRVSVNIQNDRRTEGIARASLKIKIT